MNKEELELLMKEAEIIGKECNINTIKVKQLLDDLKNQDIDNVVVFIMKMYASVGSVIPEVMFKAITIKDITVFYSIVAGFTNALAKK